ncbi:AMP-binding protein [Streptomyces sp. NBC_00882]|uniref:AMP-binding enzyme n=1 Tax=Streptomyces sp. NBC_00882 TaxID=2975856 RepID=UPI00386A1225|nr:AMP-binding protein [Streptomyces sp. NBC_00882]
MAASGYTDTLAPDHLPPAGQWPQPEFTAELPQYPDRLNAAVGLIDRPTAAFGPDRPALRTPEGDVRTYGEPQQRVKQVAPVLTEDLGLVPGNRVLVRSPGNPWTVAAWLGVLKAGGTAVTTMAALRAGEPTPVVEKTRPAIALVDHRLLDEVITLRDTVAPDLVIVAYCGDAAGDLSRRVARQERAPAASRRPGRVHRAGRLHLRSGHVRRPHAPRGRLRLSDGGGGAGAARRVPDVVESAVVVAPDPHRGSVVCAFVVLRDEMVGDSAKAREIQDHVKQRIAPYGYPRDVRFTSSLPRNPSGKLQHFKLRKIVKEPA